MTPIELLRAAHPCGIRLENPPAPVLPTIDDVLSAAARIAAYAQVTPVLRSSSLDLLAGCMIAFKCENFQRTGAFKFRGACNAVFALDDADATRGVVTHSSGNHGAALALAARLRGIPAHVVVPEGAVESKLVAIQAFGAQLHRCAPTMAAREAECARLQAATGARLVHPFADPLVIAGQGTAALELHQQCEGLDALITPVGGGGLLSGSAIATRAVASGCAIWGAEPAMACDARDSLQAGRLIDNAIPHTICDGLRGHLAPITFAILRANVDGIALADEDEIVIAMQLLGQRLKIVVEPSAAVAFAVLLRHRDRFEGQRVGIVLSGGNRELT
ncbi:MAG: pyridoxal-phosphate dependent enzyme [Lysobacteraceae bacterium]